MKFKPYLFAEVRLLKTTEGGRAQPTPSDFFDCSAGGEHFEMRMDLRAIGSLSPGSTAHVPIQFLHPEFILPWLGKTTEFTLREIGSGKKIGSGRVLEFYDSLAAS